MEICKDILWIEILNMIPMKQTLGGRPSTGLLWLEDRLNELPFTGILYIKLHLQVFMNEDYFTDHLCMEGLQLVFYGFGTF